MVQYNPKDWFSFIFQLHKADTFRKLFGMIVSMIIYTAIIAYVVIDVLQVPKDSQLKSLNTMHSLLGFALSMLLVFRTNTAYDRWWEARKIWGSLVNNSRGLAFKLNAMLKEETHRAFFRRMIPNYAFVLKNHLRKQYIAEELEFFPQFQPDQFDSELHLPNQVASVIIQEVNTLYENGVIKGEQYLLLNPELQVFADACGACERIRNTPIPFSYSGFLKKFIFFYTMTLPFGYVLTLGYWIIPVCVFVFYALASLEIIAEEIEDPFGVDANDLPTDQIAKGIRTAIREIL